MFGKSNNKQPQIMKNNNTGQPSVNMISSDTVVTGSLETKSDVRISGTIDGQVKSDNKSVIAESGLVKGDLRSKEADIAGTVEGELFVSNRLILRSTAKISGDISTKVLMVEEGARIDGACNMGDLADTSGKKENQTGKTKTGKNDQKTPEIADNY